MTVPHNDDTQSTGNAKPSRISRLANFGLHHGSASIIGPLLVGLFAVVFALLSEQAGNASKVMLNSFVFAPLIFMPAGFALITFLSMRYFPGTAGGGIPHTIAALCETTSEKTTHLLSLRIAISKIVLTVGGIFFGASVGREGPTVQVGAAIMHSFYGRGPFQTPEQRRILILAGGAAGVAAAFNTPLAGIVFAVEELSKRHVFNANSPTLMTVFFAGIVSLFLLGNYTYFGATMAFVDLYDGGVIAILICGVSCGVAGGLFSRAIIAAPAKIITALPAVMRNRPVAFAALCGLAVAIIGLATDGIVFGVGYDVTRLTLEDRENLPWYFGVAKMAATLLSTISGIPGGIFAPSLAVGAGFGENIAALLPDIAPHGAIIVLAMAAYLAGVTREPLTSFVIMMEMTNSHHMLLPLMATTVLANGASKLVCPCPLYQTLADRLLAPATQNDMSGTVPSKQSQI